MKAIKDLYRIGFGPSSSHTIAPYRAACLYVEKNGACERYEVEFRGSLALTGKGHKTDQIVKLALAPYEVKFTFNTKIFRNEMIIRGYRHECLVDEWKVISLGGGSIRVDKVDSGDENDRYPFHSFHEFKKSWKESRKDIFSFLTSYEPDLQEALQKSLQTMKKTVACGLQSEGLLNRDLNYYRAAKVLFESAEDDRDRLMAYAYAAGEENADGHMVCTGPTLGSSGIVAALMYYESIDLGVSDDKLIEALAVGGIFGDLIKDNASIAGSVGGCQAEIGAACAMAAAMIAYLEGDDLDICERAAEIGIEHHLGLTCDPVKGYVIVPCIERNANGILRAFDAAKLARKLTMIGKKNLVTFDMVVETMNYTGKKIPIELKETSLGGLALEYENKKD